MSVLSTAEASRAYIPFLNWEYIYCKIASLFGAGCAVDPLSLPVLDVSTTTLSVGATTSTSVGSGGFWSWLWPFGNSGDAISVAGTQTAVSVADVGFWIGIAQTLPGPVLVIASGISSAAVFVWVVFSWISLTLSGLLFVGIIFLCAGILWIRLNEWHTYGVLPPRSLVKSHGWSRWQELLNGAMHTDPKQWKASIIAADGMFGEVLTRLGYNGVTTSEQMRGMPDGAFATLPAAWEAHRIKNFVAARNSDFILTQRETFRVMKLYEQVFEEFQFI